MAYRRGYFQLECLLISTAALFIFFGLFEQEHSIDARRSRLILHMVERNELACNWLKTFSNSDAQSHARPIVQLIGEMDRLRLTQKPDLDHLAHYGRLNAEITFHLSAIEVKLPPEYLHCTEYERYVVVCNDVQWEIEHYNECLKKGCAKGKADGHFPFPTHFTDSP